MVNALCTLLYCVYNAEVWFLDSAYLWKHRFLCSHSFFPSFLYRPCLLRTLSCFWPHRGCSAWCPGTLLESQLQSSVASSLVRHTAHHKFVADVAEQRKKKSTDTFSFIFLTSNTCQCVFQGSLRWCSTIVFSIPSLLRFSKVFVTGGSAAPAWNAVPPCRWRRKSHPPSIDMPHCLVCLQSFSSCLRFCASVCPKCRGHDANTGGGTLMDLPIQWEGWRHHHWLLIRLALKTGDVTRIWSAYGEGGLAGLMGLSEEVHSPDDFRVPQVGWGVSGCSAVFNLI